MVGQVGGDGIGTSFDLLEQIEEGAVPLGFIGVVKFLDADGVPSVQSISDGIYPWETPGLLELLDFEQGVVVVGVDGEEGLDA